MRFRIPSIRNASSRGRCGEAGFSLIEVLIVLMIIGLVATLVGPRLLGQLDKSKVTTAKVQSRSLLAALETMRLDIGRFPTTDEGLQILVAPPVASRENWLGPYLSEQVPSDPWGRPYIYREPAGPNASPRIGTYGSDGREGGEGNDEDFFAGLDQPQ